MFQWTDVEVTNVVKLVLESMRRSPLGPARQGRQQLITSLAAELGAFSWHAHTCHLHTGAAGDARSLVWTDHTAEFEGQWDTFDPSVQYAPVIARIFLLAEEGDGEPVELITRRSHPHLHGAHHALAWLALYPDGTCECIEFLKAHSLGPFTARDEALLRVLSTELHAQPATDAADQPDIEQSEFAYLPRRQREVLSQLLIGLSVKEIASHLGISHHTVNDYIKALYRRYDVCSRGELMAAVYGHRRQTVRK